ncbi:MAG: hypothetical protein AAFO73_03815 [Pseudomonadota bacterium]
MEFSGTGIIIGLTFVAICAGLLLTYIIRGKMQERRNKGRETYRWEPETDYDVVQTGEGPMTPPWPQLKERAPKDGAPNSKKPK